MALNKRLFTQEGGVTNTENFGIVTWTGNATNNRAITTGFQPDFVWIKARTSDPSQGTASNATFDSVRLAGGGYYLYTNYTFAQGTNTYQGAVTQYNSNGFTLGQGTNATFPYFDVNRSGIDYVGWAWKAGGTAVSNTDGSITSSVSANPDAGFSIVKFTKTAGNSTVGHGLGVKPSLVITKKTNGTGGWTTYTDVTGSHGYLQLNTTAAFTAYGSAPNTSTFNNFNDTGDIVICYVFADVDGYQKIGTYTGTGATGNSVTTGFQPRFVMTKNTNDSAAFDRWYIQDSVRGGGKVLYANESLAEGNFTSMQFDSNGFTLNTNDTGINESGDTFLYLAIA